MAEEVSDEVEHILFGDDFIEFMYYSGSSCRVVRFGDVKTDYSKVLFVLEGGVNLLSYG